MNVDVSVERVMSKNPICVRRDQKISDVWRLLSQGRIHHLPVVEGGRLVGIISTLDVTKLGICPLEDGNMLAEQFLDGRLTVEQLMQHNVITISDRASVREAAQMLSAGRFHSLPVVTEQKDLVGIVTSTDLIAFLLGAPPPATHDSAADLRRGSDDPGF